jgi:hypothetical protein
MDVEIITIDAIQEETPRLRSNPVWIGLNHNIEHRQVERGLGSTERGKKRL